MSAPSLPDDLQAALERALAAAATARHAAEKATAQAAAAAGDATSLRAELAALRASRPERMQEDLKQVPWVGPLLALLARHVGASAALLVAGFLLLAPLAYPLLLRVYLPLLPEAVRDAYAEWVGAPFLDKPLRRLRERNASEVRGLIEKNDERRDFVQHLQQQWTAHQQEKSPMYYFPVARGQLFSVRLRSSPRSAGGNCKHGSAELKLAQQALHKPLFSVNVLNADPVKTINGDQEDWVVVFEGNERYWRSRERSPEVKVQVLLHVGEAEPVWRCFPALRTDLLVVVDKSIKDAVAHASPEARK